MVEVEEPLGSLQTIEILRPQEHTRHGCDYNRGLGDLSLKIWEKIILESWTYRLFAHYRKCSLRNSVCLSRLWIYFMSRILVGCSLFTKDPPPFPEKEEVSLYDSQKIQIRNKGKHSNPIPKKEVKALMILLEIYSWFLVAFVSALCRLNPTLS